jgi:hypothetical protein
MTPVRYAQRYLNLEVPFPDGAARVSIGRYLLRNWDKKVDAKLDAEKDALLGGVTAYFKEQQQKDKTFTLALTVDDQREEFASVTELKRRIANPFYGKGSPEDCQIVLLLAVLVKRTTKPTLQTYCDTFLGLDCNGFVGNYIFRVVRKNGWKSDAGAGTPGPSTNIRQIMAAGVPIRSTDDLAPGHMYVLAEVDGATDQIIPGAGGSPGHIAISEPSQFQSSYMSMNLDLANSGMLGTKAIYCVESTGGLGLAQSWYAVMPLKRRAKEVPGVFRVYRNCKHQYMNVRIVAMA